MLIIASTLCFLIGIIHSYLGERYILVPLLRGDRVPHLFGGSYFTKRTLRFAWHLTTLAWWGFGYLLLHFSVNNESNDQTILYTICTVFFVSGVLSFGFTKGKHLSWLVFWSISALVYYVAKYG